MQNETIPQVDLDRDAEKLVRLTAYAIRMGIVKPENINKAAGGQDE